MLNVYDFLKTGGDGYRKLSFGNSLFVHYRCPQQERYTSLYTHLNYFLYVINGKKAYHQFGRSYMLDEGTCAFIRKGGFHQERFYDADWELMAFFVPDDYLTQFVQAHRSSLPIRPLETVPDDQVLKLNVNQLTRGFFASMIPYFFEAPGIGEPLVELKFRELIFNVLSDPANDVLLSYLDHLGRVSNSDLRELMESNYMYNLTLAEFARITHRSLTAFKRDFSATFKLTPGKWLLNKRLQHAEALLVNSHKQVTDIADESGFENQTHFNRVFREKFGLSPLQYRKQKRPQG
jgi:AraC-like DNA-binding protein